MAERVEVDQVARWKAQMESAIRMRQSARTEEERQRWDAQAYMSEFNYHVACMDREGDHHLEV